MQNSHNTITQNLTNAPSPPQPLPLMDDSTNRNALYLIESCIDELERDPTNNEQLARIDELKSLREILLIKPPNSSLTMVEFLECDVIYILKSRIHELKVFPTNPKQVISEVEILLNLNKEDVNMESLNSSLTSAVVDRIKSRIDKLKEGPTNKLIIRELKMLHEIFVRLYKQEVQDYTDVDTFEEMIVKTCLVKGIVNLLSFASPEHRLFNPDLLDNLPAGDPMLLLDENDLETIHQFVSKPDDSKNMRIRDAISKLCIKANWWLEHNIDVGVHPFSLSVRLKKIISAINNPPNSEVSSELVWF